MTRETTLASDSGRFGGGCRDRRRVPADAAESPRGTFTAATSATSDTTAPAMNARWSDSSIARASGMPARLQRGERRGHHRPHHRHANRTADAAGELPERRGDAELLARHRALHRQQQRQHRHPHADAHQAEVPRAASTSVVRPHAWRGRGSPTDTQTQAAEDERPEPDARQQPAGDDRHRHPAKQQRRERRCPLRAPYRPAPPARTAERRPARRTSRCPAACR